MAVKFNAAPQPVAHRPYSCSARMMGRLMPVLSAARCSTFEGTLTVL
jgi:hypothetical protein